MSPGSVCSEIDSEIFKEPILSSKLLLPLGVSGGGVQRFVAALSTRLDGTARPLLTKIYRPRESSPGEEYARVIGGTPETSASDRDRKWDRAKGERVFGGCGGSGGRDNVIMTSSGGSGFPDMPSVVTRVVESTGSAGPERLGGAMAPSGGDRDMNLEKWFC